MSVYFKVSTPLGNIWVLPQGKSSLPEQETWVLHCLCEYDFQSDSLNRQGYNHYTPAQGSNPAIIEPLIIRGIEHRGTFHAYQWQDGTFHPCHEWSTDGHYRITEPRRQSSEWEQRRGLYLHRVGYGFNDNASDKAKNLFQTKVMLAITQWAQSHMDLLVEAYRLQLSSEIAKAEEDISKAMQASQATMKELQAKLAQLQSIEV